MPVGRKGPVPRAFAIKSDIPGEAGGAVAARGRRWWGQHQGGTGWGGCYCPLGRAEEEQLTEPGPRAPELTVQGSGRGGHSLLLLHSSPAFSPAPPPCTGLTWPWPKEQANQWDCQPRVGRGAQGRLGAGGRWGPQERLHRAGAERLCPPQGADMGAHSGCPVSPSPPRTDTCCAFPSGQVLSLYLRACRVPGAPLPAFLLCPF